MHRQRQHRLQPRLQQLQNCFLPSGLTKYCTQDKINKKVFIIKKILIFNVIKYFILVYLQKMKIVKKQRKRSQYRKQSVQSISNRHFCLYPFNIISILRAEILQNSYLLQVQIFFLIMGGNTSSSISISKAAQTGGKIGGGVAGAVGGATAFMKVTKVVAGWIFANATTWQLILVGGGIFMVACLAAYGAYYLFKYQQDGLSVHQKVLQNFEQKEVEFLIQNVPKWQPLPTSQAEMKQVKAITLQQLKKKIERYVCPISRFVTREPYETPCGHTFQKTLIIPVIARTKECPMCRGKVTVNQLVKDFEREDAIQMLRFQIRKCYPSLTEADKVAWKIVISEGMGDKYIENDI